MNNFLKIADNVQTDLLLDNINRQPELWKEDTYLRDYPQGPFKQIESIMLRFPVKRVVEMQADIAKYDQHESVDYEPYDKLPEARSIVMPLMAHVGGERLGRVMINKIEPGGRIFRHADTPAHAEYFERFHVVLKSSPGCQFKCGDEEVYMAPGELWWFNNAEEHEVLNYGTVDRIHMIVDIRTSKAAQNVGGIVVQDKVVEEMGVPVKQVVKTQITYQVESWSDVWPEMEPLWSEHYEEIALDKDKIELDPDMNAYNAMEAAGQLHVVTVRADEVLVGYQINFIRPHLHYRRSLSAFSDVYWVHPDYRKGRTGIKLLKETEKTLKARGVEKMFTATKLSLDMSKIFVRLGWTESERAFVKWIGD